MTRIRLATTDDAALLSRLAATLFEQTFARDNTPDDMAAYLANTFRPDVQSAELAHEACRVWIAEDDEGSAIGYAMLWRDSRIDSVDARLPAEVQRIYVDRSLHGQRVGDALMRTCTEQAVEWGCDVLWLAVWQRNPRAIAFYEKGGFRRVGVKTFQLGSDVQHDYVMARNL
ncbi:MAG TPA: GNAT family N-acetyltransferase [Gemmatimonadaceae bacterium]|jgi:GNAT superfamily N-acetyltransferase|nr:GNAT family N-acetyltransferase [Gemmatimonadaceae bacterium]